MIKSLAKKIVSVACVSTVLFPMGNVFAGDDSSKTDKIENVCAVPDSKIENVIEEKEEKKPLLKTDPESEDAMTKKIAKPSRQCDGQEHGYAKFLFKAFPDDLMSPKLKKKTYYYLNPKSFSYYKEEEKEEEKLLLKTDPESKDAMTKKIAKHSRKHDGRGYRYALNCPAAKVFSIEPIPSEVFSLEDKIKLHRFFSNPKNFSYDDDIRAENVVKGNTMTILAHVRFDHNNDMANKVVTDSEECKEVSSDCKVRLFRKVELTPTNEVIYYVSPEGFFGDNPATVNIVPYIYSERPMDCKLLSNSNHIIIYRSIAKTLTPELKDFYNKAYAENIGKYRAFLERFLQNILALATKFKEDADLSNDLMKLYNVLRADTMCEIKAALDCGYFSFAYMQGIILRNWNEFIFHMPTKPAPYKFMEVKLKREVKEGNYKGKHIRLVMKKEGSGYVASIIEI